MKQIVINVHAETHAFIKEAASGNMSDYARILLIADAAKKLKRAAPEVPALKKGKVSPFAAAAAKAGLSVAEYQRKCACEAAGVKFVAKPAKTEAEKAAAKASKKATPAPATAPTAAPAGK